MVAHYLKIAFRTAVTRRSYSLINVAGLSVAMACCILILVYVVHQLSYDRYHQNADRIYRLVANLTLGGTPNDIASTNAPPALAMVEDFPEVVGAARFRPIGRLPFRYEDRHFYEERVLYADASVFEVFSFPLIRGNPATALTTASSIVITETTARRYFGDADPMGKRLIVNNRDEYTVTGILADVRPDSHFVFDMLCSLETLYARDRATMESWMSPFIHYSYVLLHEDADVGRLEAKLPGLVEKYIGEEFASYGASVEYFLQPLTSIHLHSNLRHELAPNGHIGYVKTYVFVALAILLIACFNFMNLATARSSSRSKEVGVRKVLGANRRELICQFLAESMLYSLVSLILAMGLAHVALPFVGELLAADSAARAEGIGSMAEHSLQISYLEMPWLIPALLGLAIAIGLLAGSYPALFLASMDPARTMKGGWIGARGNTHFRRVLVALQFAISVVLIIATGVVVRQLGHLQEIRLGFNKEDVVVISLRDDEVRASLPAIKEELLQMSGVQAVGASSHVLGGRPSGGSYMPEGYPEGQTEMMDMISIDDTYLSTLGMDIVAGRGFSADFPADEAESILINEAAARKFGWDDAIGKRIGGGMYQEPRTVIGVVADFHFSSPHRTIGPIYISHDPSFLRALFVRIAGTDVGSTIDRLRDAWQRIDPDRPFDYTFLDTSYDEQYQAEQNLGRLFGAFAALAIFIACLGLYGIASFTAERRTKEIGVRKVLGSTVSGIVYLLSRELIVLGLAANLVAWPVAYLLMRRWLEAFPYQAGFSPLLYIAAPLLMLTVGFLTISYLSVRAARAEPVEALRCE